MKCTRLLLILISLAIVTVSAVASAGGSDIVASPAYNNEIVTQDQLLSYICIKSPSLPMCRYVTPTPTPTPTPKRVNISTMLASICIKNPYFFMCYDVTPYPDSYFDNKPFYGTTKKSTVSWSACDEYNICTQIECNEKRNDGTCACPNDVSQSSTDGASCWRVPETCYTWQDPNTCWSAMYI